MKKSNAWNHRRSDLDAIAEITLGIILLLLVMGFWVSLWVPPLAVP